MATTPINAGGEKQKKPGALENFAKVLGIANNVLSVAMPMVAPTAPTGGIDFKAGVKPNLGNVGGQFAKNAALDDGTLKATAIKF